MPPPAPANKDVEEAAAARWHPALFEQPPIEAIKAEQKAPLILAEHFARTSGEETATSSGGDGESTAESDRGGGSDAEVPEAAARRGWGRRYTRREMEEATGGLAAANVMGEGGYGVVFRGVLRDGTAVAIKNLHNNRLASFLRFEICRDVSVWIRSVNKTHVYDRFFFFFFLDLMLKNLSFHFSKSSLSPNMCFFLGWPQKQRWWLVRFKLLLVSS
jgi:hypothetical protein